jgi:LmbE family N-acetylglucosaminyl deacetylase
MKQSRDNTYTNRRITMNTNNFHSAASAEPSRREFLTSASGALTAAGTVAMPMAAPAADPKPAGAGPDNKKTFLAVEGHLDDAFIGAGGVFIQAARAGHRVVIVTVASDYTSWAPTVGREERVKREQVELAQAFGLEKRFLDGKYHQTIASDLDLKRKLAEIYVELKPDAAFIAHHEDHWPDHANSGLAAKDAFLFSHGLSHDMKQHRCPLILGYSVTPGQTYHFDPDVFYDVTDVMPAYMDLIGRIEAIRTGRTLEAETRYEFRAVARGGLKLPLTTHGMLRLADAIRWGDMAGCQFAIGFKIVWGQRRGPQLF